METLEIRRPDDFHVHLRDGDMLIVAQHTAKDFARALVMPNLTPPVLDWLEAANYRDRITLNTRGTGFQPLMTIKLVPRTTPAIIRAAKAHGVTAAKAYPVGVTTNSDDGISDFSAMSDVFAAMQEVDMVLCLHGESPGIFSLDRESHFVSTTLRKLHNTFPRLRIVLEHVTTSTAIHALYELGDNVAASLTVHHLLLTLDDVIGDKIKPHNFCKPVAKYPHDVRALKNAVMRGDPRVFLGTDSAPHSKENKECAAGCAGIFTAPVAMPILAELFESWGCLNKLEPFTSEFGAKFYGLPLNMGTLKLVKQPWTVPSIINGVVPFHAGKTLSWQVANNE